MEFYQLTGNLQKIHIFNIGTTANHGPLLCQPIGFLIPKRLAMYPSNVIFLDVQHN